MTNRLVVVTALCAGMLLGCGGKKAPGKDWSGKELSPVKGTLKDGIEFTVSLPEGFKLEDRSDDITQSWEADLDDPFSEPGASVSYQAIPPKSLDQFMDYAMLDDTFTVAKKEELKDGYLYVAHTKNKGYVKVERLLRKGDKAISCRASQAKQNGVPSPDATMAWLEKLCMSLTF